MRRLMAQPRYKISGKKLSLRQKLNLQSGNFLKAAACTQTLIEFELLFTTSGTKFPKYTLLGRDLLYLATELDWKYFRIECDGEIEHTHS